MMITWTHVYRIISLISLLGFSRLALAIEDDALVSQCLNTMSEYAFLVDTGSAAKVAELFTSDGRWQYEETVLQGQEAIRSEFLAFQQQSGIKRAHVISNQSVTIHANGIRGRSYFTLYKITGNPSLENSATDRQVIVGFYEDDFVIEGNRCLIRSRRGQTLLP